jgi:hypothetical protein
MAIDLFTKGNRVLIKEAFAHPLVWPTLANAVLEIISTRNITDIYPAYNNGKKVSCSYEQLCRQNKSAALVGHPQWVTVNAPGFGQMEFSGAFFKIAPAGRLNEVESRV